jgi:hypothetical protein
MYIITKYLKLFFFLPFSHLGAIRSESVSVSRQTIKDIPREKRAQWRKDMKNAAFKDESVNLVKQKM